MAQLHDLGLAGQEAVGGHVDGEWQRCTVDEAGVDLATCARCRFEHGDVEAATTGLVRGGQSGDPAADDHDPFRHG